MAISPPSDIVLDVAKAADPLQYRAAVEKLSRLSSARVAATESFETLLDTGLDMTTGKATDMATDMASGAIEAAAKSFDPMRADLRSRLPVDAVDAASAAKKPYQQFEAFVLQTFIQEMLPKDAQHVFGDGIAGGFWSSMLAEQVAGQVAKDGGIGIADVLARGSTPRPQSSLPGYVTSLELGFADAVLPSHAEAAGSKDGEA